MAADFLDKILTAKRIEVATRKREKPLSPGVKKAKDAGDFKEAIARTGLSLIAEIKRASPSKGLLALDLNPGDLARSYREAGARAVSVLTDKTFFQGSLGDLTIATIASGLPTLRKDFIIDHYQIYEAAQAGASAVLLIVAALPGDELVNLLTCAGSVGLDCLVEVHDADELRHAQAAGAKIIGINNRDLTTFEVFLQTTLDLLPSLDPDVLVVSESGIRTPEDIRMLTEAGVHGVLIGEALVTTLDPKEKIRELMGYE